MSATATGDVAADGGGPDGGDRLDQEHNDEDGAHGDDQVQLERRKREICIY